ncbi:metallopeptidase TldD-related protein [Alteromonas sp. BMJM2]|uniref:metallopeptidase TldD-related protein n=1 Tax=Alteromonas sp. BMJM2 TaxID=2954241 RepID=UPI0022B5332D|nr:metallopeptidase TldD-related protein [Alteromonas sp. BMJM2]
MSNLLKDHDVLYEWLEMTQAVGADSVEIQYMLEDTEEITHRCDEKLSVHRQSTSKTVISLIKDFKKACIITSNPTEAKLQDALKNVSTSFNSLRHDDAYVITQKSQCSRTQTMSSFYDINGLKSFNTPRKIHMAKATIELLREQDCTPLSCSVKSSDASFLYLNSNDVKVQQNQSLFQSSVAATSNNNCGQTIQETTTTKSNKVNKLFTSRILSEITLKNLARRKVVANKKTGALPVIFTKQSMAMFWKYILMAIQGHNILGGMSFLSKSLGQKIAASHISLSERPQLPEGINHRFHDDEGVYIEEKSIVDKGTLTSLLLNNYSARKLGLRSTGNANSYTNIKVMSGINDFDHLVTTMGTGYIITRLSWDGVNLNSGNITSKARGYLIESGRLVGAVDNLVISGNFNTLLHNIAEQSNRLTNNERIVCPDALIEGLHIN